MTPTWPAVSAAALTRLLPLLGASGHDGAHHQGRSGTDTGLGPQVFDLVEHLPLASTTWRLRYQGFEQLLACALGHGAKRLASVVMPEVLASGAYRHLYELDTGLSTASAWDATADGFLTGELAAGQRKVRRGTLVLSSQQGVWEWLSAMIQGLALIVTAGAPTTLAIDYVSFQLARDSVINTVARMQTVPPVVAPAPLFADWTWRIGPYSASVALDSSTLAPCTRWSLRLENNLEASAGPRTGYAPDEYERSNEPRVTLSFTLPRSTTDVWQTRWVQNTRLMAIGAFQGPVIGNTSVHYALTCYLPSCQVTNAVLNLAGAQIPSTTVELVAIVPTAAAAGFPTMQRLTPLALELVSGEAQHALL